jgi:hypothetical protein
MDFSTKATKPFDTAQAPCAAEGVRREAFGPRRIRMSSEARAWGAWGKSVHERHERYEKGRRDCYATAPLVTPRGFLRAARNFADCSAKDARNGMRGCHTRQRRARGGAATEAGGRQNVPSGRPFDRLRVFDSGSATQGLRQLSTLNSQLSKGCAETPCFSEGFTSVGIRLVLRRPLFLARFRWRPAPSPPLRRTRRLAEGGGDWSFLTDHWALANWRAVSKIRTNFVAAREEFER